MAVVLLLAASGCALLPRLPADRQQEQCFREPRGPGSAVGCSQLENYQECYLVCGEIRRRD